MFLPSAKSLSQRRPVRRRRLSLWKPGWCVISGVAAALACTCAVRTTSAQANFYLDGNSTSPGAGTNAQVTTTWGGTTPTSMWSNDATGASATSTTGPGAMDTAFFTANDGVLADNPTGAYTVTLGAAQSVAGIVIGLNSTSGGTLTLAGTGAPGLTIGAGGITLNGSSGDPTFAASLGTLTVGADQTWTINNTHVIAVAAAVAGNATAGNTRVLTLGYVNAFTPTISGLISDGVAGGTFGLTLNNVNAGGTATGAGTWILSGTANTFTGAVTIGRGNLQVASLANSGTASSLGTGVGTSAISIGSGTNAGSLTLLGTSAMTTNRAINLAGTTGGATLINNSTAAANTLTFTGALSNTVAGAKTLTLGGSNVGANTFGGVLSDSTGTGALTIAKTGAGTWALSGANTYTGGTTIGAGTLSVTATGNLGANAAGNNITIGGGNLLLSAATNFGANQIITVNSGGIGVGYTPAALPAVTDNTGTTGGIYGINYTGTGGVTSEANGSLYNGNWFLGSFTGGTYTGATLGAGNPITGSTSGSTGAYRLGGGGGTLTVQNPILAGSNDLLIGNNASGGTLALPTGNTFTGTTTLQNGTVSVASINSVAGGAASSSLGAPITVANGTIAIGSGANAPILNYTGPGETTDRVLNFAGTTGTVTIQNSGTGALNFTSAPTFTGAGAKTITLGVSTDTFGGTLGPITNTASANVVGVTKAGLTNSIWSLTGTNTYTGTTTITGGVLSESTVPAGYINLNGTNSTTQLGVLQTAGTITRTLSGTTAATSLNWQSNSGFAALGGKLTLTFNAGATLTWGGTGFMGTGTNPMVYGSTTSNNQVELTNNFTLGDNVSNAFSRVIQVNGGSNGDSALISGIISLGVGTGGNTLLTGINKTGSGTLLLSGLSTYTGTTGVGAGTLIAMTNAPSGAAGAFGNAVSAINLGLANINGTDGTVATGASPSLLIGGAFTVARPITISNLATTGRYSIGGSTDNAATFSGAITTSQNMSVTQVATTGANALNITGGITGGATTAVKTINFDNAGAVNVTTTGISNGAGNGTLAVTKTNAGVLTFAFANTYTGSTSVIGGTLTLQTTAVLSDTGLLSLASGTSLRLDAAGGTTETVGTLVINGVGQTAGIYTAAQLAAMSSGVTFESLNGETLTVMTTSAVPEPSTWVFCGFGGALLIATLKRTRARA